MTDAMKRVFAAAQCRTQAELAIFFGTVQSSVANVKKRGVIPAEWLLELWFKADINPKWVLTGEEPRLLSRPDRTCVDVASALAHYSCQELMTEMVRRSVRELHLPGLPPEDVKFR